MPRSKAPKTRTPSTSEAPARLGESLWPAPALRLHPQGAVVPELADADFEALRADIDKRGLLVPLEVTERRVVLDGRARLRAALDLGLAQVPVRIVAPSDEVDHLIRAALLRRNLNAAQKACLVVELAEYEQAKVEGRKRQRANLKGQPEVAALPPRGGKTREWAAELAGVSPRTVQDVAAVREADPALFAAMKRGELSAERAAQEVRRQKTLAGLESNPPLPDGRFALLYADPPWQLGNPQAAYAPENYYPTLPLEEIKALAVPCAEDACLFLWAVNSQLPQALEVMAAWGFAFRTSICWDKKSIALGVWARNRHELLLFGIRGSFSPPAPKDRCDSVIEAPRGRHSQKPVEAYEWIERMYPRASKLELFARGKVRPGWAAWGNEVER